MKIKLNPTNIRITPNANLYSKLYIFRKVKASNDDWDCLFSLFYYYFRVHREVFSLLDKICFTRQQEWSTGDKHGFLATKRVARLQELLLS